MVAAVLTPSPIKLNGLAIACYPERYPFALWLTELSTEPSQPFNRLICTSYCMTTDRWVFFKHFLHDQLAVPNQQEAVFFNHVGRVKPQVCLIRQQRRWNETPQTSEPSIDQSSPHVHAQREAIVHTPLFFLRQHDVFDIRPRLC